MLGRVIAERILTRYWTGLLPVDVLGIAKSYGIILDATHEHISPVAAVRKDSISYNPACDLTRIRYAVAHALGHIAMNDLLKAKEYVEPQDAYSISTSNVHCQLANEFAEYLLVPKDALEAVLRQSRTQTTVDSMCEIFGVSGVLMGHVIKKRFA